MFICGRTSINAVPNTRNLSSCLLEGENLVPICIRPLSPARASQVPSPLNGALSVCRLFLTLNSPQPHTWRLSQLLGSSSRLFLSPRWAEVGQQALQGHHCFLLTKSPEGGNVEGCGAGSGARQPGHSQSCPLLCILCTLTFLCFSFLIHGWV